MKKGYILKAILAVFLFFTVLQAVVIPAYSWYEHYTGETPSIQKDPPVFSYTDSEVLDYNWFIYISPPTNYDAPLGFTYQYSTTPSCEIDVYAMTYADFEDWYYDYSHTKKVLESGNPSGSGSYRFNSDTRWVILFWNVDYSTYTTVLSYTVTVEKVAPIGLIIGLSVAGVVVAAIVVGAVVSSRKKSRYIPPSQPTSTYSGYGSTPYGSSQTPVYGTPTVIPTTNIQNIFNTANSEFQKGNVIQAMNLWEQILGSTPDFYPAMCNLAVAHMSLGNIPRAVEYLNQALVIKPDYKPALDLLDIAKTKQAGITETDNDPFA